MQRVFSWVVLASLSLAVLPGCGDDNSSAEEGDTTSADGGGDASTDGGGTTMTDPASTSGYCDVTEGWDSAQAAEEEDVVRLMNEQRTAGAVCNGKAMPAVAALVMDEALRCASRVHSKDMDDNDYFSHTSENGDKFTDRADKAGGRANAENIAKGQRDAAGAVSSWMGSTAGHCEAIMNERYKRVGIGNQGRLWTAMFGR